MKGSINSIARRRLLKLGAAMASTLLMPAMSIAQSIKSSKFQFLTRPQAGININGIADFGTEQPFVDLFKHSRKWTSQAKGKKWGKGPKLDLDAQGWIKRLEPNASATKLVSTTQGLPSDRYVILYDGEGRLKPHGDVKRVLKSQPGRIVISLKQKWNVLKLDLLETNPDNYIRNIRIVPEGMETHYLDNPWSEDFLKRWSGMACIRMMDCMATNNSTQQQWSDRPVINDASYAAKGIPLELMVDLANRLNTDIWFCMPHKADDDYITQFADYVAKHLDRSLNVWVEYSNEVWNSMFSQSKYVAEEGKRLKLADSGWKSKRLFTAKRSLEIFAIWETQFGADKNRVVKVLPGQASSENVVGDMLRYENAAEVADVIAIAPYFGMSVPKKSKTKPTADVVSQWSLDQLFEYIDDVELPKAAKWIENHQRLAQKHQVNLVAYESGQHLVGIRGAEGNDQLTELFFAANADPRMKLAFEKYLSHWEQAGGGLICLYSSMGKWTKWGSWGLLQNRSEDPAKSSKFSAVVEWAKRLGQPMSY